MIEQALVVPQRIMLWACEGGRTHPTTLWLARHLNPRRLYLVRRLGVLHPGDRECYGILLCQLQVCTKIIDLEVHEDEWGIAATMSQIREHALLN